MKNTKAVFFIILGSFIIATGFAFAENTAFKQLEEAYGNKAALDNLPGAGSAPLAPAVGGPAAATSPAAPTTAPAVGNPAPAATAEPAAKPEEKKPFGQVAKEFIGKNKATMVMVGVGAFVGFALAGTMMGAMTGGLFFFAMLWLARA